MYQLIKDLYYNSEYKDITFEISDVCFLLDNNWKRIGISSSGGADSTLMAYILCKEIEARSLDIEIHIIHNVRLWKTRPWQRYVGLNVLEYFKNKFKNINFIRHENFIPPEFEWGSVGPTMYDEYGKFKSGNQIELRAHAEFIGHTYKLDAWYCGVNKNPDDVSGGMDNRNFELNADEDFIKFVRLHMNVLACHPLTHVQKDWIVGRYKELNIMDLFELTRSCEGDDKDYPEIFQGLDYRTYQPGMNVPECGKCFWCKERDWGLKYAK